MKADIDKVDINKLVNVRTSLNNLKTKVDDLYVGKLKTVFAKINDVVDKKVVKDKKFNTLQTKVNK